LPIKATILDAKQMERALIRMAHEIVEDAKGIENLALVGLHRQGVPLANRLADCIAQFEGTRPPVGSVDITLYRDDLALLQDHPKVRGTNILFPVRGKHIVLVDDVLFTGRSTRAAIDAVNDIGRADIIRLAVLIDREHHEVPIRADFVGKDVPTSRHELIRVHLTDFDGYDAVTIEEKE